MELDSFKKWQISDNRRWRIPAAALQTMELWKLCSTYLQSAHDQQNNNDHE
jgi:hypothetical protein